MSDDYTRIYNTVLVVGEDPRSLMSKYDKNLEVEPHVVNIGSGEEIKRNFDRIISGVIERFGETKEADRILSRLREFYYNLAEIDPDELRELVASEYDTDAEGNLISTKNPNGRWASYEEANPEHAMPLILKETGERCFSAIARDIDWDATNGINREISDNAWEVMFNGAEPIKKEMDWMKDNKTYKKYLESFGSKENYLRITTTFFTYAYLDKDGWHDLDDENKWPNTWIQDYRERFTDKIGQDEKVSIFIFEKY